MKNGYMKLTVVTAFVWNAFQYGMHLTKQLTTQL
jgi:hypothetical protein